MLQYDLIEILFLYQLANNMSQHDMAFLYPGCISRRYIDEQVADVFHFSTSFASKPNGMHFFCTGNFQGFYNIGTVAGSTQADEYIAFFADTLNQS